MFSGKIILNFGVQESLRTFLNPIFTGGVVEGSGRERTPSASLRSADSPFCRCATSSPAGGSQPSRRRLCAMPLTLPPPPKAVPLGKVAANIVSRRKGYLGISRIFQKHKKGDPPHLGFVQRVSFCLLIFRRTGSSAKSVPPFLPSAPASVHNVPLHSSAACFLLLQFQLLSIVLACLHNTLAGLHKGYHCVPI